MSESALWISLVAVICSCYFAACSGALRSFTRSKLSDLLESQGREDRFEPFLKNISKLILICGTLRMAMNLVVLLGVLWLFEHRIDQAWVRYIMSFAVAGLVISILAVAVPLSLARYRPERLLQLSIPLLNICLLVFSPLASALRLFDPVVRRMLGADSQMVSGDEELTEQIMSVVEDHEDEATVDENQKDMLEGVIELRSTAAGQIMTPRTEVKGIEVSAGLDQVKAKILQLRHSRMPVYDKSLDDIIGVLYAKDMIRYVGNGEPWDIHSVIRKAYMVPESKPVNELLAEFKARKVHMAIVLDEYGGTAGLVTIEDVLEEIVGEIHDEYEPGEESPMITRTSETAAEIDARVRVNELNDEFDLELPEDEDYDTVGGFVFWRLGHIPEVGESFEFDNFRVTVIHAERTKVTRVRLEMLDAQTSAKNSNNLHR